MDKAEYDMKNYSSSESWGQIILKTTISSVIYK